MAYFIWTGRAKFQQYVLGKEFKSRLDDRLLLLLSEFHAVTPKL